MFRKKREFPDALTKSWYQVGMVMTALLIIAAVVFLIWGDKLVNGEPVCMWYRLTGLCCFGCGGTRAFYYLVHGNLVDSFLANPVVLYAVTVVVTFMGNTWLYIHTNKIGIRKFPITVLVISSLAVLLVNCVIRNILLLQ